jgi:hypothetical protein
MRVSPVQALDNGAMSDAQNMYIYHYLRLFIIIYGGVEALWHLSGAASAGYTKDIFLENRQGEGGGRDMP